MNTYTYPWLTPEHDEFCWSRNSPDLQVNQMTPHFLHFGAICGLKILNGIDRFPETVGFTLSSKQGNSTIDYLLALPASASKISDFRILPLQPESSHLPLSFHLSKLVIGSEPKIS